MLDKNYENFSDAEKERFSKMANYLLNRTFVTRETYEAKDKIGKINADYRFIERNIETFNLFFGIAGYELSKDDSDGIITINSLYPTNLLRLDKFSTLVLLTLRQIYDDAMEKAASRNVTFVSISDLIVKMIDNKYIAKKPTVVSMVETLRTLIRHNIIARYDGSLEDSSAILTIYPTICKVVSNEKINIIYNNLFKEENTPNTENAESGEKVQEG